MERPRPHGIMHSPEQIFLAVFLVFLAGTAAVRVWLERRHLNHVAGHRERVPAEFASRISLDAHHKAADYTVAKTRLGIWEILAGTALTLAFTVGGGLEALSELAGRVAAPGGYAHGILLILAVGVVSGLVDLPFGLYRTFVIEARFGFNKMTLGLYLADLAKQAALGAALGAPLVLCVLWLMARAGDLWWLWTWGVWMVFNLAVLAIYPTFIAPLFNKFTPLSDQGLRSRIDALLAKCGFRARGLFVMDGSRRSSHGNAYFTGFGAAKRIVFFDTLLTRLEPPEVEAVLAHELGHFARRHIVKRIVMIFAGSFVLLALLGYAINQPWFYGAFGIQARTTAMALVLFFMVVPVFTYAFQPIAALYSRRHEYEADAYAAANSNAADLVQALVKLYQDNASTLTPDPLHSAFYDSHPPASLRIARLQAMAGA
ncbi:MAG TPA: M48 family metallopeptidase [Burkholderiales bacterium]|nr:M48 family metallopeptidase [Burkholderiales bacterium]